MPGREITLAQYIKPWKGKQFNREARRPNTHLEEAASSRQLPIRPITSADHTVHLATRYGNTRAIIQDAFSQADGSIAHYSDLAFPAGISPSGGLQAWLVEKQRRVSTYTSILEVNDYTSQNRATCQPAYIALSEYRLYKKLFGERKFAQNYPASIPNPSAKPVGLFDLPGEIRNRIYRYVVVFEDPFELLPKANGYRRSYSRALRALDHGRKQFTKSLGARKFLRVNKQINTEASDIFYGENEFCFRSIMGWQFLQDFMETVGYKNASRLRKISVHIHWHGSTLDCSDPYSSFWDADSPDDFLQKYKPLDKVRDMDEAYHECIKIFEDAGALSSLSLVLPYAFDVYDFPSFALNLSKFDIAPKIKLIHLDTGASFIAHESQHPLHKLGPLPKPVRGRNRRNRGKPVERAILEQFKNAKVYAVAQGWQYEPGSVNCNGEYSPAKDCLGWDGEVPKDIEEAEAGYD